MLLCMLSRGENWDSKRLNKLPDLTHWCMRSLVWHTDSKMCSFFPWKPEGWKLSDPHWGGQTPECESWNAPRRQVGSMNQGRGGWESCPDSPLLPVHCIASFQDLVSVFNIFSCFPIFDLFRFVCLLFAFVFPAAGFFRVKETPSWREVSGSHSVFLFHFSPVTWQLAGFL